MAKDPLADAKQTLRSADAYAERTYGKSKPAPAARTPPKIPPRRQTLSARNQAWGQPRSIGDNVTVRDALMAAGGQRKKKRAAGRSNNGR